MTHVRKTGCGKGLEEVCKEEQNLKVITCTTEKGSNGFFSYLG